MNELIARITSATGLDAATVEKAVGIILAFLAKEAPEGPVQQLLAAIPGAEAAIASAPETGGGLMGMMGMGGGVMALGQKLMSEGVGMRQMQSLGSELFAYGREKAGEDTMGEIVASVPGLSQFV